MDKTLKALGLEAQARSTPDAVYWVCRYTKRDVRILNAMHHAWNVEAGTEKHSIFPERPLYGVCVTGKEGSAVGIGSHVVGYFPTAAQVRAFLRSLPKGVACA